MTSSALQKMSEADYLRTEESSPFKREYIDGFVYALHADDSPNAQAGALSKHGVICANLIAALHRPALQQGGRVYASDMRVRVQAMGTHYYSPDVVLTCEPMDDEAMYASSPCLIVEVLSRSTQDADRREKLWAYQQLPSLQGYLLIDTATRAARLYTRSGEGWSEEYAEGQGVFMVPCVNITLALDTMYEATSL